MSGNENTKNVPIETKAIAETTSDIKSKNISETFSTPVVSAEALGDTLSVFENKIEKLNKDTARIESLVFYGFIVIIFALIALIFGYLEFVYSGNRNDEYKYDIYQRDPRM